MHHNEKKEGEGKGTRNTTQIASDNGCVYMEPCKRHPTTVNLDNAACTGLFIAGSFAQAS